MSEPTEESANAHLLEVSMGDFVFEEGDLGTEMFIVHRGRVEVLKNIDGGVTQLAVFEQGDFFGELSLLDDEPRSASVRALEDSVLVRVNGATFIQMLRETPEVAVRMLRKLSTRLRKTDRLLQAALGRPVPPSREEVAQQEAAQKSPAGKVYRLFDPASGITFQLLAGPETTVGRADPVTGINPGIDLTSVDVDRSSSRRHAKIYRRDDRFYIAEEIGTMNGTFINGKRIGTGAPAEVKSGDMVRFGVLELEFQEG
jgi:CRP-like cAMP-binding protein